MDKVSGEVVRQVVGVRACLPYAASGPEKS